MMYGAYTAAFAAFLAVYWPRAVYRRFVHGVPFRVRERFGYVATPREKERIGWIHAVSVGETIAAVPVIEGVRRLFPELPLVVTTVTETGARVARARFAGIADHRFFPLDFPGAVRRTIRALDPAFLVCLETELWPNLFRALAVRGVPIMIANGRISDRSYPRYRLIRRFLRPVLENVRVFAMQSEEDARRVIGLGAAPERVVVTGNLKHEPLSDSAGASDLWHRLLGLGAGQPVWIAGSTHRGEEDAILDAHRTARQACQDLVLVIAPRHPERVPEVMQLIQRRGEIAIRRSELPRERNNNAIIVLDTVGELAQLYSVADVVFVGGSLVPAGGHNMLEASLKRKPVLFGPHTNNFRDSASLLVAGGGGLMVGDAGELGTELQRLLADADLRSKLGNAGYESAASRHGAVQGTLDLIARFLYPGAGP